MPKDLPKLLDRDFIAGYYLPALLFVSGLYFLFAPLSIPAASIAALALSFRELFSNEGAVGIASALGAVALAIFLMLANTRLIQIFEGYDWPLDFLPCLKDWMLAKQRAKRADLNRRIAIWEEDYGARARTDLSFYGDLKRQLVELFPSEDGLLLPTSFGNIVRAFEVYSLSQYGIDAIPVWFRLTAVIPDAFSKQISSAKVGVDCSINLLVLSLLIAPLIVVRMLLEAAHNVPIDQSCWDLMPLGVAVLTARISYEAAKESAISWGHNVKAAFDLYRDDLARQLGYVPPLSREAWIAITKSFLYGEPLPRPGVASLNYD